MDYPRELSSMELDTSNRNSKHKRRWETWAQMKLFSQRSKGRRQNGTGEGDRALVSETDLGEKVPQEHFLWGRRGLGLWSVADWREGLHLATLRFYNHRKNSGPA